MRVFGRGDIKNKARGNRKHHVNLDITYLACFGFTYFINPKYYLLYSLR